MELNKGRLEKIWSEVPVDYYDKGEKFNFGQKLWHGKKFNSIKCLVANLRPVKILDIGCNSGVLTNKLFTIFPKSETIGVDVYKDAIDFAKEKYPKIKFIVADGRKLPFKNNYFDLITCVETLEHVFDPKTTLFEIRRCLKNDGRVIISMDTGNFLFNTIWFFWTRFGKGKVWRHSHLTKFNRIKLKNLIISGNFEIEEERVSHLGMSVAFKIKKK